MIKAPPDFANASAFKPTACIFYHKHIGLSSGFFKKLKIFCRKSIFVEVIFNAICPFFKNNLKTAYIVATKLSNAFIKLTQRSAQLFLFYLNRL